MLSIILGWLAVGFIIAQSFVGPIYTMYDGCVCHRSRAWLQFEESSSLRLFLRIETPGDPKHQHQFYDAKYDGQYPVLIYIGVGFGLLSAATWLYRRKRVA
jgi:hypothetical protein